MIKAVLAGEKLVNEANKGFPAHLAHCQLDVGKKLENKNIFLWPLISLYSIYRTTNSINVPEKRTMKVCQATQFKKDTFFVEITGTLR